MRDKDFSCQSLAWFAQEARYVFDQLVSIPGVKVYPCLANFLLIKVMDRSKLKAFNQALISNSLYLRGSEGFRGLDPSFFRLSLRLRADHDRLLKVFRNALAAEKISVC